MRRLLTIALLTMLWACAGNAERQRVTAAQEATRAAGTARFSLSQAHLGGDGRDYRLTGEGELDFGAGRGRVLMVPQGLGDLGDTGTFETVYEDGTVWVRAPVLGAPTAWVRLGTDGPAVAGEPEDFSTDPSRSLAFLRGAGDDVVAAGREDVRGVPTTRYRFTADLERAAASAPRRDAAFLREQIASRGLTRLPAEVWLDAEGRLRRQVWHLDVEPSPADGTARVETTIEYYDFGRPVQVQTPPPDQVTDFTDLLRR